MTWRDDEPTLVRIGRIAENRAELERAFVDTLPPPRVSSIPPGLSATPREEEAPSTKR